MHPNWRRRIWRLSRWSKSSEIAIWRFSRWSKSSNQLLSPNQLSLTSSPKIVLRIPSRPNIVLRILVNRTRLKSFLKISSSASGRRLTPAKQRGQKVPVCGINWEPLVTLRSKTTLLSCQKRCNQMKATPGLSSWGHPRISVLTRPTLLSTANKVLFAKETWVVVRWKLKSRWLTESLSQQPRPVLTRC